MKKAFKISMMCLVALMTVGFLTSCDKDESNTNTNTNVDDANYVDLGLPSGNKWKTTNETNPESAYNLFTFDEAVEKFGDQLPTRGQLDELLEKCDWTWDTIKKGCNVVGPNGNSIFLPAAGSINHSGNFGGVGQYGSYWSSSTSPDNVYGKNIYFGYDVDPDLNGVYRDCCNSVRLVKTK